MGQFVSESGVETNDIGLLMEEGLKVGLHFVFSMHKNFISAYNDTAKYLKSQLDTALIAMKMSDQTIYTRTSIGREEALPEDQVYLHYQASQTKLKITKWEQNGLKIEEMSLMNLKFIVEKVYGDRLVYCS